MARDHILLCGNRSAARELIEDLLLAQGFVVTCVDERAAAEQVIARDGLDLVIAHRDWLIDGEARVIAEVERRRVPILILKRRRGDAEPLPGHRYVLEKASASELLSAVEDTLLPRVGLVGPTDRWAMKRKKNNRTGAPGVE